MTRGESSIQNSHIRLSKSKFLPAVTLIYFAHMLKMILGTGYLITNRRIKELQSDITVFAS